jgi:hypothetical protein
MYNTTWTNKVAELSEDQQKNLDWEVLCISEDLDCASDLIFHTVFLTEDDNGPIVIINGKDGIEDALFLTYYETAEWKSL